MGTCFLRRPGGDAAGAGLGQPLLESGSTLRDSPSLPGVPLPTRPSQSLSGSIMLAGASSFEILRQAGVFPRLAHRRLQQVHGTCCSMQQYEGVMSERVCAKWCQHHACTTRASLAQLDICLCKG